MAIPETKIDSVASFVTEVDRFVAKLGPHRHLSGWFRGHGDQSWALTPGAFRSGVPKDHLFKERHVFRDFQLWSAGILPSTISPEDLYFRQQHHGVPTRLLDWTTNALVALYFAVENDPNTAAAVYAMNAYSHGEHSYVDIDKEPHKFVGFSVESHPLTTVALAGITRWRNDTTQPSFIFPVRPAFTDIRMQIQRSCFTYHPPSVPTLTEANNPTLVKFIIDSEKKMELKYQLNHLGIDHFSIYGDLDALAKTLKHNYSL